MCILDSHWKRVFIYLCEALSHETNLNNQIYRCVKCSLVCLGLTYTHLTYTPPKSPAAPKYKYYRSTPQTHKFSFILSQKEMNSRYLHRMMLELVYKHMRRGDQGGKEEKKKKWRLKVKRKDNSQSWKSLFPPLWYVQWVWRQVIPALWIWINVKNT